MRWGRWTLSSVHPTSYIPRPVPDVVFALTGDVRANARAMRQLAVLSGLGASVRAVGVARGAALPPLPLLPGVTFEALGVPDRRGPRFFWDVHRAVGHALRHERAAVFHASDLYTLPALSQAARRSGAKTVFDSRELYPDTPAVAHRPLVRTVWRAVERVFVPRADRVLTVADGLAEVLTDRYGIARPLVLANAPRPHDGPSADLHAHAGLPPEAKIVLHTGALRAGRGLLGLVEAMASVQAAVPEAALVLLGSDGGMEASIRARAEALGVRLAVATPVPPEDVPAYVAAATVAAVTLEASCLNLRLALPNKLFEAVAGGVPIVATDTPALRSVVERFGIGEVVPQGDTPALAAALVRVLTDDAFAQACRAQIPTAHRAYNSIEADRLFADLYRSLLPVLP